MLIRCQVKIINSMSLLLSDSCDYSKVKTFKSYLLRSLCVLVVSNNSLAQQVEKGEQVHYSSSKVSAEPTLNVMKDKTADLSLLKDSQAETGVCTPKNLKRILQRKKPRSISKSLKKNEQKRGSFESPKSNEVFFIVRI